MDIGHKILMLRKQQNITQEKLAAEMGVSIAAVSKWETGNSMPDIIMLCALADFFKVTTDELLGRNSMEEFIICDDAPVVREALRSILVKEGYPHIVLTENGGQLLDALEKRMPYAVLLDIHLPDADGLKLLQKIKSRNGEIKVIMVTADASEQTKNRAIELGADAYVTKPFLAEHISLALGAL
ncbi:MAG: response regulator [Butyrivibrio sp.]|nr:response regulator [Butyrivibrio sp.]